MPFAEVQVKYDCDHSVWLQTKVIPVKPFVLASIKSIFVALLLVGATNVEEVRLKNYTIASEILSSAY